MTKFLKKMIIPTLIMVWATIFLLEVLQYPPKNYILIKPLYFVMLAFYVINGILDFFACKKDGAFAKDPDKVAISMKEYTQRFLKSENARIALVFASLFIASILFNILGFFIVVPLLALSILLIAGIRSWKPMVIVPLTLVVVLFLIFKVGLNVRIPYGIFG